MKLIDYIKKNQIWYKNQNIQIKTAKLCLRHFSARTPSSLPPTYRAITLESAHSNLEGTRQPAPFCQPAPLLAVVIS